MGVAKINGKNMITMIETKNLVKNYYTKVETVEVLRGINLKVEKGEVLSIMGPSGVGKSTLLHIIGTLDEPTSGEVVVNGEKINFGSSKLSKFRSLNVGFIYQFHHLLPEFTALENVTIPSMILHGRVNSNSEKRAKELLATVGLQERFHHKPSELSGGELQRVAIARSFMNDPDIILADEPTGNLDQEHGNDVFDMIVDLNKETGKSFIIVTHNRALAEKTHRIVTLIGGQLHSDEKLKQ